MHEIICPWIQYMNLLHFLFKEEVALKVFIWERKNKDISVKTHTFACPLRTIFFPSNILIYGISRDGSKNVKIRTCEHMIHGQLRIWAHTTTYAALQVSRSRFSHKQRHHHRCPLINIRIKSSTNVIIIVTIKKTTPTLPSTILNHDHESKYLISPHGMLDSFSRDFLLH